MLGAFNFSPTIFPFLSSFTSTLCFISAILIFSAFKTLEFLYGIFYRSSIICSSGRAISDSFTFFPRLLYSVAHFWVEAQEIYFLERFLTPVFTLALVISRFTCLYFYVCLLKFTLISFSPGSSQTLLYYFLEGFREIVSGC